MRFQHKVVMVTGAGSGIGREAVLLFAKEGARVVAIDKNLPAAQETLAEVRRRGGDGLAIGADVSKAEEISRLVKQVIDEFGRIDVVYNHAGINRPNSVTELHEDDWDAVIDTNVKSIYLMCKEVFPHMIRQGGGAVVNTAGTFAFYGAPTFAAYSASKGAVLNLTKQMALDYGRYGIRVNCVCPGFIDTPMNAGVPKDKVAEIIKTQPLGRAGRPEEVAKAALFLASDDASFVTGAALLVDGGQLSGRHV